MPRQEIPAGLICSMCSHCSSGIKISAWVEKRSLSSEMGLSRGGERWDSVGFCGISISRLFPGNGDTWIICGVTAECPPSWDGCGCPMESLWELSWALFTTAWSEKSGNVKECWCILLRSSLWGSGLRAGLGISLQEGHF